MQPRIDCQRCWRLDKQALAQVGRGKYGLGGPYLPVRPLQERLAPGLQPGLPGVDLLAGSDQRYDHRPVAVTAHDVEEHRRLALVVAEPACAECGVPGALRLVEHHDVLVRRVGALAVVAQETDQRLDRAFGLLARHAHAAAVVARVAGQCLAHHMHQRQIAGQECRVAVGTKHDVEAAKRFAGARDAGDEQHEMKVVRAGLHDGLGDRIVGPRQVADIGPRRSDFGHTVATIQHGGGLDDGRYRAIGRNFPGGGIERSCRGGNARCDVVYERGQSAVRRIQHRGDGVPQQWPGGGAGLTLCDDQDRHHRMGAAVGVEVEQIERVILDLLARHAGLVGGLELQHQDGAVGQQHRIDPFGQAQQGVFQQHPPLARQAARGGLQQRHLRAPGGELRRMIQMVRLDQANREALNDRLRRLGQQRRQITRPPRAHVLSSRLAGRQWHNCWLLAIALFRLGSGAAARLREHAACRQVDILRVPGFHMARSSSYMKGSILYEIEGAPC